MLFRSSGISFPKEEFLLRLFDCLETDPNTLFRDSFQGGGWTLSTTERTLLEQYRGMGAARFPLVYTLTDETFSLVSSVEVPEGVDRKKFYLSISLLHYVYWSSATLLGGLLGKALTMDLTGIDFALTALFVVLFLEHWKKKESRPAGLAGLGCAALSLGLFGEDLVIPAMVMILAVLLGGRKKLCPWRRFRSPPPCWPSPPAAS